MRVLIVDDDAIVLSSIEMILKSVGVEVVGSASSGIEAYERYKELMPDVVLMDIRMEEVEEYSAAGIWATKKIISEFPDAKILLLTTFNEEDYIKEAIKLGAKGYILKQNFGNLKSSLEAVMNDNIVLDRDVLTTAIKSEYKAKLPSDITDREMEIIELVSDGLNNKEIANKLFLSEGTVRNYLSIILEKLECRDRTQLVIKYLKGEF